MGPGITAQFFFVSLKMRVPKSNIYLMPDRPIRFISKLLFKIYGFIVSLSTNLGALCNIEVNCDNPSLYLQNHIWFSEYLLRYLSAHVARITSSKMGNGATTVVQYWAALVRNSKHPLHLSAALANALLHLSRVCHIIFFLQTFLVRSESSKWIRCPVHCILLRRI